MKNKLIINSLRNINKSFPRFLTLFIMSFLGVFVFAGLQATEPDMIKTLDNYYDKWNNYDIEVVSTLGLTNDDLKVLNNINGIKDVEESYHKDQLVEIDEENIEISVTSLPSKINKVQLVKGHFPKNKNEIVVEDNMIKKSSLKLGDFIKVSEDDFYESNLKIVGTVSSSMYINSVDIQQERGSTSIGTGKIIYYSYVNKDNFKQDYYDSIYLTVENTKELITNSDDYNKEINKKIKLIENIKDEQIKKRYNLLYENIDKEKKYLASLPIPQYVKDEKLKTINKEIEKLNNGKWLINDRSDYVRYTEYLDDANSIKNLSLVFPIIFFAVAVLVSLISMNRMVEDDRQEIGTLKSLGFTNGQVAIKYLLFASIATIFGSLSGSLLGIYILPKIIFSIYKLLFTVPNFVIGLNLKSTLIGFVISTLCVCGTTLYTVEKMLKEKTSELMRPKPPKNGKRVLLENIDFIWDKINFSNKVVIRNIFRYKKRVLITIIGIAGCTSLVLLGFGIKDAVSDMPSNQYGKIFKYEAMLFVNDANKENNIIKNEDIKNITKGENLSGNYKDTQINIFIIDNEKEIDNVMNLYSIKNNKKIKLKKDKVIITEKLASLHNLHIGDKIDFIDIDHHPYSYEISNIVKNHLDHYIIMDKESFSKQGDYNPNLLYLDLDKMNDKEKDEFTEEILSNENIFSIVYVEDLIKSVNNLLLSLNKVVVILIILASMLSFVVLYNLSNINISERNREIATLKVLGFYNKEVDSYITKENTILTIIGIIIGLIMGYFLTKYVITTVEIERARFMNQIKFLSYFYSILISVLFTLIVNFVTHFTLKKIDMISSLKSVE